MSFGVPFQKDGQNGEKVYKPLIVLYLPYLNTFQIGNT
mgnify:FL=1